MKCDDEHSVGHHIGPADSLSPAQRAQQAYLHGRGFCTITQAAFRVLDYMAFNSAEMRALPLCANEDAWRRTVAAESLA